MTQAENPTDYTRHRDIYRQLRDGLTNSPDVLDELLRALGLLISEYDTSIRENRFIAGGATERILATTMRSVGIANARARGLDLSDEDIVVDGHQISVKASVHRRAASHTPYQHARRFQRGMADGDDFRACQPGYWLRRSRLVAWGSEGQPGCCYSAPSAFGRTARYATTMAAALRSAGESARRFPTPRRQRGRGHGDLAANFRRTCNVPDVTQVDLIVGEWHLCHRNVCRYRIVGTSPSLRLAVGVLWVPLGLPALRVAPQFFRTGQLAGSGVS